LSQKTRPSTSRLRVDRQRNHSEHRSTMSTPSASAGGAGLRDTLVNGRPRPAQRCLTSRPAGARLSSSHQHLNDVKETTSPWASATSRAPGRSRRSPGAWIGAWTTRATTSPSSRHRGSSWRVGPREARRRQRIEDGGGWGGVTLAYNVRSPDEVDESSSGLRMRRSRSTVWNNSYKRTSSPTWMRSQ
jgi:hypothetical protein